MSRFPVARFARRPLVVVALVAAVGCATVGQLNIVSEQEEIALGAQFAAELEGQLRFIDDPEIVGYIEDLGQELVRVSKRSHLEYHFHVVDTEDVNAFAVPGGWLYVNRGLIEAADSESELAGVIGHEIGHVVGKHSARQMTQQHGLALIATLVLGENPGMLASMTAQIAATGAIKSYSRDMESEADSFGVQELYDAGIDPEGLASFFVKLEEMRGGREASSLEQFFSTHPEPGRRAAAVRAAAAALPPKPGLRRDSDRFRAIQAKVKALPKPPPSQG